MVPFYFLVSSGWLLLLHGDLLGASMTLSWVSPATHFFLPLHEYR